MTRKYSRRGSLLVLSCFLCSVFLRAQTGKVPPLPPVRLATPQPSQPDAPSSVPSIDPQQDLAPSLRKFVDVLSIVQNEAADPVSADPLIYEGAIPSMLRQLDPHTQFFDPDQFSQLKQMEQSEQKGFGSVVSVLPGQVIFLQTLPGTPSNKAGIQAGDELLAIGSVAIRSLEPQQIVQLLTQARQQKISILVRRQGSDRPLQFSLSPELVDAPSVDRAFMLDQGYGYIRVASWDVQTGKQLRDALDRLKASALNGLILDLRNNPGGIVGAALDAASLFLSPGQRILTAKGRTAKLETVDIPKQAQPLSVKLAVLINEKTASASEILAGALQDHDRAVIVGEASYGKGLVQTVMPLSDGAGLAITTAYYYTPSGRSIQHPLKDSALSSRFGQTPQSKPANYKTDKGRSVMGGGGIQPDLHVTPRALTRLEAVLDASGVFTSFATQYLSSHSPLPDPFSANADVIDDFKVFLASRQIQPSIGEWSTERTWVSNRLREEIVTQARGVDKGDEIQAQFDPQVQAALKALRDNSVLADAR